jgi:hypothetical protein
MRPLARLPILLALLAALAPAARAAGAPLAPPRLPMAVANPVRVAGVATMTPAESLWYNRLLAGMTGSQNLINNTMRSNDLYSIGRDGGNYVEALLMAFRVTGETRFLDRVVELSQMARDSLRDRWVDGTTDGYTDWQWLIDPTNATYYGNDLNWLDESITSGNVALWTWAFDANRALDPRYAAAADFWRGWLENQFLAKWYARAGGNPLTAWNTPYAAFYKPDCEPRSANWRLAYYLWKVTGNTFYRDRAEEIRLQLVAANVTNPAHPLAYRWAKELDPTTLNWQACNYANYYMRVVLEMNLEGVPFFTSNAEMKRFAATFRDVVYAASQPARTTMANDVNGGGSTAYALYAFNGFSPWDSTGFLMNLANQSITGAGNYAGGGLSKAARNDVFISAYALMALHLAGSVPTLVTAFQGEPLEDGRVRIGWQLAEVSGDLAVNLYRLAPDGVERIRVNVDPVLGPGAHELIDSPPAGQALVTYELTEVTGAGEQSLGRIAVNRGAGAVDGFALAPAEPNPFADATQITFDLPRAAHVRLAVLDASGRTVRVLEDADLAVGSYRRAWDGLDVRGRTAPSGVYFVVGDAGMRRVVQRAVLLR